MNEFTPCTKLLPRFSIRTVFFPSLPKLAGSFASTSSLRHSINQPLISAPYIFPPSLELATDLRWDIRSLAENSKPVNNPLGDLSIAEVSIEMLENFYPISNDVSRCIHLCIASGYSFEKVRLMRYVSSIICPSRVNLFGLLMEEGHFSRKIRTPYGRNVVKSCHGVSYSRFY